MRTKIAQTFIILTFLFSCNKRNKEFEKAILGEWKFAIIQNMRGSNNENEPPPFRAIGYKEGYRFHKNDSCDDLRGYFAVIQDSNDFENRRLDFLGTKTIYKIEYDSLKIYNRTLNKWLSNKIQFISNDTLSIYSSDSLLVKYSRLKYYNLNSEKFDKIIVSSSGCYGYCPISDIYISSFGEVIYSGQKHNKINGLFSSKISKEKYLEIESNFNKANINQLENDYQVNHTDDEQITVTFIKSGKIVKTIADYGGASPSEFIWAYTPVRYLYQNLKLDKFNTDKPHSTISRPRFESKTKVLDLSKSEIFFLFTELLKSNETKNSFTKKFSIELVLDYDSSQVLTTDGRYFKTIDKTYDLGYDFISKNNLTNRIRNLK